MNESIEEIADRLSKTMQCNCDLDNWQPHTDTNHSWVCRIDKAARIEYVEQLMQKKESK